MRSSSACHDGNSVASAGLAPPSGASSSSAGASASIGMRSKKKNSVWPSSMSEPSVSTARLVVWPSTIEPFLLLGVDQHPAAEARLDACVLARHPLVGHADRQLGAGLLGPPLAGRDRDARPSDRKPVPYRTGARARRTRAPGRAPARGLDRSDPLSIRMDTQRRAVRVAHWSHPNTRPGTMSDPIASRRHVGDLVFLTRAQARTPPRHAPGHQRARPGTSVVCALEVGRSCRRDPGLRARARRPSRPGRRAQQPRPPAPRSRATSRAPRRATGSHSWSTTRVALYWFNLGVVLEDQGRAAEAIAAYEHALAHRCAPRGRALQPRAAARAQRPRGG